VHPPPTSAQACMHSQAKGINRPEGYALEYTQPENKKSADSQWI
jgi:hypothetical protein